MKKLITILLMLFLTLPIKAEVPEWLKVAGLYSTSIALNATGDALNHKGIKEWGHACNAASTGLLLASPFVIKGEKDRWIYHGLVYVGIRFATFDPVYNSVRGLPIDYIGNSSVTDKFWQSVRPPGWAQLFGRVVILSMSISFAVNEIGK